uniref:Peroxidasin homolog n=1 Tax=Schistocephalus solidus TaxID=70667 RepID=A0A0X3NQS8_SCHSO
MGCLNILGEIIAICTLILSISYIIHAEYPKETAINVQVGENFNFCCSLPQNPGEALTISFSGRRIRSLLRQNNEYNYIDADTDIFVAENPGYRMSDVSKSADQLCISKKNPGAEFSDDKKKFRCDLVAQSGLGKILKKEEISIHIYELPQIATMPEKVEVTEGGSVNLDCSATGRPNLQLLWKKAKSGEVLVSTADIKKKQMADNTSGVDRRVDGDESGALSVGLELTAVRREQDGEVLICEASTSYPPKQTPARRNTTLSVNYPARLEIRNATVYTDLGAAEDIEIVVYGKPEPLLECDLMNIQESRDVLLAEDGPNKRIYYIRLYQVKPDDIGQYRCSATNILGTDYKTVQVTLNPSAPVVTSPNFTSHADYYLLSWRAHSKAPLHNVTLRIESRKRGENNVIDAQEGAAPEIEHKKVTFTLNATEPSPFGAQEYWHHLPNLTMDAEHRVYVWVCNKHACSGEPDHLESEPAPDGKPHIVFKTPSYNGSNKVDPAVLRKPPSAAQLTAPNPSTPSDVTGSAVSFYALPLLVASQAMHLLTL